MSYQPDEGMLRPFEQADIPAIDRILHETYPWTEYVTEFSVDPASISSESSLFVYDADSEVIGFVWGVPDGSFGRSGYIRLIGVDETHQGHGVGTALMDRIESFLFDESEDIFLLVSGFNDAAVAFYRDRGYTRVGTLENYVEEGIDEYLLRKHCSYS